MSWSDPNDSTISAPRARRPGGDRGDHGFAERTYDVRLADGSDGYERGIDVLEFANGRLARKDAFRKVRR